MLSCKCTWKAVTSAGSAGITVEDRVYKVDENGKISYVKKNPVAADDSSYELQGTGSQMQLVRRSSSGSKTIARADYGVQSYCIVDNSIFSALMWKRLQMENGTAVFIKRI